MHSDFDRAQQARIDHKAAAVNQECRVMTMIAIAEITKLASHHIRGLAQSRRFWNERNRKITPPEST